MNVQEIRQRIFDQMDYFPDLQQYRDSVVRRINDRYQEINDKAHWLFLQKETEIYLKKKVSGGTSIAVYPISTNLRRLRCVGFIPTIEMEGQILTDGTAAKQEFKILRVLEDSSNVYDLHVEPIGQGMATGYDSGFTSGSPDRGFTIEFQRYKLPLDCIEVLGIVDRADDRGVIQTVSRKREEIAYLDRDNEGEPSVSIDDEFFVDSPPISDLALVSSNRVNGDLVVGNKYSYKYTLYREGRESPSSNEVQVTISTGHNAVDVSKLDDTRWRDTSGNAKDSGIQKFIYRRDVTNDGPWLLVKIAESQDLTYYDLYTEPLLIGNYEVNNYYFSSNEDFIKYNEPGPYQYMRFWYVPDTDRTFVIRYHRRPRDLQADNDSPEWPRHYHQLLVYLTLEDMFLQLSEVGQSQLYAKRGEEMLVQMKRRFLARDNVRKKFARWDRPRRFRNVYGIPITDFGGA
jgi:hypothetical protein